MNLWPFNKKPGKAYGPTPAGEKNPYLDLRRMALTVQPERIGLDVAPDQPVGVIMEMGMEGGTATVLALADGTASLYLSSGGGTIGGHAYEAIRQAGARWIAAAGDFLPLMQKTATSPLPALDHVRFYVLTRGAVYTHETPQTDLIMKRDSCYPMFHLGQDVLTQLRLITEKRR